MNMAKKQTPPVKTEPAYDPSKLVVDVKQGEDGKRASAQRVLQPEVRAALLMQKFEDYLDVNALAAELKAQTEAIVAGDMSRAEAMLGAQAHTLDALFTVLARRAHSNMVEGYGDATASYMKLALRAQAQAVRTIEALGELKNPKQIAFVAQANIASGHQQVNNGEIPRAGKNKLEQTKLIEGNGNGTMDTGGKGAAIVANPAMEAVEELHRAKNNGG